MEKQRQTITVLKNFDGLSANVIGTVERKIQYTASKNRKGVYQPKEMYTSYRGNRVQVFRLGGGYGEVSGLCISVK